MARKVLEFQIVDAGRDIGKTFVLTEMSAMQAEKWAIKALLALGRNAQGVPDALLVSNAPMQELAIKWAEGMFSSLGFEDAEPLLDEMFRQVQIKEEKIIRFPTEDDIQEISTIFRLRGELLKLHMGFFSAASTSEQTADLTSQEPSNIKTFRAQSGRPLAPASRPGKPSRPR